MSRAEPSDPVMERRAHRRAPIEEPMIVRVFSARRDGLLEGSTFSGTTRDACTRGLRLRSDRPMESGWVLGMWVKVRGVPGSFLLSGEVRWCRPLADGKHESGVAIRALPGEDAEAWARHFRAARERGQGTP
jgi:hypothetical protein